MNSAYSDFEARLRGGLREIADQGGMRAPKDPVSGDWGESGQHWLLPLAAAGTVAVLSTAGIAAGVMRGSDGASTAQDALPAQTQDASTGSPTAFQASRGDVDDIAGRITQFEGAPGYGRVSVDYQAGAIEVLWKGPAPVSISELDGAQGVSVWIAPCRYDENDILQAARRLFAASAADLDGASIVKVAPNSDLSGAIVSVLAPWEGDQDTLEAVAGIPVRVVTSEDSIVALPDRKSL